MKNANTAPAFRMWTPTGDFFPEVGASAVGFGKTLTDVDTKWFNKDTWRIESFLKRGAKSEIWVDPSASKNAKGGSISAVFGYDDMERNIKYRGTTDDGLKHTSEVSYTLPFQAGTQRVKVSIKTALDKDTFIPKTDKVETKVFWKAMLPRLTTEVILKQGPTGPETFNMWAQGEITDNFAYGGMVEYTLGQKSKVENWELGLLNTLPLFGGVFATRFVTRNADLFELGILPPPNVIAATKITSYLKLKYNLPKNKTDVALAAEATVCPKVDLKARFAYENLSKLTTAFAAIWAAPNGWRVAASISDPFGDKMQFGVRFAQGSTPAPL